MPRPVYAEISRFKKIEASLRGVRSSLLASQAEIQSAAAGGRTAAELAVLKAAGDRVEALLTATRDAHRQFWFDVEALG